MKLRKPPLTRAASASYCLRYEGGVVSQYLHKLPLGAKVPFRHIKFNLKLQYPFSGKRTLSLVCAGSGITPIFQVITKVLTTPTDDRPIVLLYSNKTVDDILLKEELHAFARSHPKRFKLVHVIGNRPTDPPSAGWVSTSVYTAETGWIDESKIAKYAHPPDRDTLVFVCGLPPMYAALCGPREEKALREGTALHRLGYTTDMVVKM